MCLAETIKLNANYLAWDFDKELLGIKSCNKCFPHSDHFCLLSFINHFTLIFRIFQ